MKKTFLFLLAILLLTVSCTSDNSQILLKEGLMQKTKVAKINDTISVDSIVPVRGDRNSLKMTLPLTRSGYDDSNNLSEELYQLNEIPIYLQVQGNTSDRRFLSASGKGRELTVEKFNDNAVEQEFYLKILPATSGIPYLIYSKNTGTPIRLGEYTKKPDVKVLYASNDATGDLFGASWDIKRGQYTKDSYIIENEDYPRQGSSGSWYDIYYSVITVNDSKISFEKYNKLPQQEFAIIPVEKFKVESITFNTDASATLAKMPSIIHSDGFTNNGPISQNHTFSITDTYNESSTFNRTTSYNVSLTTNLKVKVPFISDEKITISNSSSEEYTYGKKEEHAKTIAYTYPVVVPKYSQANMSLTLYNYTMDVDYVATCVGLSSGRKIKITGRWYGVQVQESNAVLNITPLNQSGTKNSRKIIITKEMLNSNKFIKVE